MCTIKNFKLPEDSPYTEAVKLINEGYTAPLIYGGWEDYLAPFGDTIREWVAGDITGEDALNVLDDLQQKKLAHGSTIYTTVTEELTTEQAAQLCGQMFMEATGADAALISYNIYQPEVLSNLEDGYGANGRILIGDMTEELDLQDTGIVGLKAAEAYLEHMDELSSQTLDESLVQHVELIVSLCRRSHS